MMMKRNRLVGAIAALASAASLSGCGGNRSDQADQATQSALASISTSPSSVVPGVPTPATPPAVPFDQARFSFAPVTGAPATVLMNISSQLGKEAFAQHVTLVPPEDPTATYIVKGYLSAVGDVQGTILVYVWDVFDKTGRRVHRISGQETTASGGQDPWSGVDLSAAQGVARRTIGDLVAWGSSS